MEGVKGIGGDLFDHVAEGRLAEGHLVFARKGLDLMEEVVRGNEENGQRLENCGVVSGKLRAAEDGSLVEMSEPLHVACPMWAGARPVVDGPEPCSGRTDDDSGKRTPLDNAD